MTPAFIKRVLCILALICAVVSFATGAPTWLAVGLALVAIALVV